MFFESIEGFLAYVMLYAAGIFSGSVRWHSDADEVTRQKFMPFVYALSYLSAVIGETDKSVFITADKPVVFKLLKCNAYTWLAEVKVVDYIYGADSG